ncbi:UbiH/UbiF family hydroxylase [Marinihelvus fidelis]|uniref:UbiH/UbiF family hydroxylase n=1 Tax=Marinihelvus fidelis TaxID=2613842 RepID=A0A5N0T7D3_9GAMM|nr:FAD-dependent monooxygenase [Marinihelvus fidelis]KAA9130802.1 UbiH/UbiF family hydroxylase [Marinihelvus fidelis]
MTNRSAPVIVVGGGIVGAVTASLLDRAGWPVMLVDPGPAPVAPTGDFDLRVSAVSPGSAAILGQAGGAGALQGERACAYRRMVVEDRHPGTRIEFEAPAFGLERLGTLVENEAVRAALWQSLDDVEVVRDRVRSVDGRRGQVTLAGGRDIEADLVIACDGAGPGVRTLLGISESTWEYNQAALVCEVRCQAPNPGTAWQRFLDTGPLAFLPLASGASSIVWTLPAARARELADADQASFHAALDDAGGDWLGGVVSTGPRATFPLVMRASDRLAGPGAVLLGDAAHAVHPLAGQGVNLGLADAAALVEALLAARAAGREADADVLAGWARQRQSESGLMARGIHALGGLFGPGWLGPVRALGIRAVSASWLARDAFVRRAAGLGPGSPRLARGATLKSLLAT